jgi:hypothetical protein
VQTEIDYLNLKCASRGHYIDFLEAMRLLMEAVRLSVESLKYSYRRERDCRIPEMLVEAARVILNAARVI